jgi:hypothetical protein
VLLLALGLVVGVAGHLAVARAGAGRPRRPSAPVVLVVALALAMPVVALLYGLRGPDLFLFPRNLSASLPFVALVLGMLLTPPRRALAVAAVALAGTAVVVAGVTAQERRHRRPDLRGVAEAIDAASGPRDLTFYYGPGLGAVILGDGVRLYAHEPHRFTGADTTPGQFAQRLAAQARDAPRTFVVSTTDRAQQPPPAAGWTVTASRTFPGHPALVLRTYSRRAG